MSYCDGTWLLYKPGQIHLRWLPTMVLLISSYMALHALNFTLAVFLWAQINAYMQNLSSFPSVSLHLSSQVTWVQQFRREREELTVLLGYAKAYLFLWALLLWTPCVLPREQSRQKLTIISHVCPGADLPRGEKVHQGKHNFISPIELPQ